MDLIVNHVVFCFGVLLDSKVNQFALSRSVSWCSYLKHISLMFECLYVISVIYEGATFILQT